jgi:hypothetical protein
LKTPLLLISLTSQGGTNPKKDVFHVEQIDL